MRSYEAFNTKSDIQYHLINGHYLYSGVLLHEHTIGNVTIPYCQKTFSNVSQLKKNATFKQPLKCQEALRGVGLED